MPRLDADADVAALWLETVQRIAERAAHEIKGALNGVALNVEVVRSRSARAGAEASAVAPYAAAAQQQLEALTAQTEALLALMRPVRGRCDIGVVLGRFVALAAPIARASGGELRVEGLPEAGGAVARVAPEAVRLALGGAIFAALDEPGVTAVEVTSVGERFGVTLRRVSGSPIRLPAELVAVVTDAGVHVEEQSDGVRLAFAARGDADTGDT